MPWLLLSHAVMLGYVGSVVMAGLCAIGAFRARSATEWLLLLGFLVPCAGLFMACIAGERCIARHCKARTPASCDTLRT